MIEMYRILNVWNLINHQVDRHTSDTDTKTILFNKIIYLITNYIRDLYITK